MNIQKSMKKEPKSTKWTEHEDSACEIRVHYLSLLKFVSIDAFFSGNKQGMDERVLYH